MAKVNLEKVKQMILQISSGDRKKIVPFLAELSDSGIYSYNLREELEVLKNMEKDSLALTGILTIILSILSLSGIWFQFGFLTLKFYEPYFFLRTSLRRSQSPMGKSQ